MTYLNCYNKTQYHFINSSIYHDKTSVSTLMSINKDPKIVYKKISKAIRSANEHKIMNNLFQKNIFI